MIKKALDKIPSMKSSLLCSYSLGQVDSFVVLYLWHPKWNYYWWAYKIKQPTDSLWWIGTTCPTYRLSAQLAPGHSALCWAALCPFIFTENMLPSLFISLENNLPSNSGCGRQWPSIFVYMWIAKGLCWNTLWVSRLWCSACLSSHILQVIGCCPPKTTLQNTRWKGLCCDGGLTDQWLEPL